MEVLKFFVSASHACEKYAFNGVVIVEPTQDDNGDDGFYTSINKYGCSKTSATPEGCIRDMLLSHGCTEIMINPLEV